LPAFIGHLRLVFGAIHSLAEFVDIGEHLLLFLLEPLELASNLGALFFAFGLLKRRLKFL
jgi:hypothetical protein